MAARKKVVEEEVVEKKATKKAAKKVVEETPEKKIREATIQDYDTIICPIITDKTMIQMQKLNQVTVKVSPRANKTHIKKAFEGVFNVHVTAVKIINIPTKEKSRGGKYKGFVGGYKKAVVTVKDGEAIDLFRE